MRILFLHLSDLHMSKEEDLDNKAIEEIAAAVSYKSIGHVDKTIILVTGDISFSGKKQEFVAFNQFKEMLCTALGNKGLEIPSEHFFLVPGNHDIDYSGHEHSDDRAYYEDFLITPEKESFDDRKELYYRDQFLHYSESLGQLCPNEPLFIRKNIDLGEFTIEVNLLNTSFFSLLHNNDQGLHYFPSEIIKKISSPSGANMAITLMHHSYQWFNEGCKRELEEVLLKKNTLIFCGHEHYSVEQEITYNGISPAHICGGGELCDRGKWSNSEFYACVYDTEKQYLEAYSCQWNPRAKVYNVNKKSESELPYKFSTDGPQKYNENYVAGLLEDHHMHISEKLSDYYVFPGIACETTNQDEEVREIDTLNQLYKLIDDNKHIEISGRDSSGKSALLRMIFQHYLHQKYVLFCGVDEINSGNRGRIIRGVFEDIYGDDEVEKIKFKRAEHEKKMILIDDIHLIKPQHLMDFLEGIEDEFGYVVYTTNNYMKLNIQERIKSAIAKDSYLSFRILSFYRSKRKELVERVIPLKYSNYLKKEQETLAERICHILELQRNYIPLSPEIILQFIEHYANHQMESVQNDGNIFGKVFESSITNTLSPHMPENMTVDKAMLVLAKIAFYIHKNKKYPISSKEIISVINCYCDEYGGRINSINFIKTMEKARILTECGDGETYKFCNNNYLAYFIASEICNNKDREAVANCLEYACFGLNSTILMFVTYLTNETVLIDSILAAAHQASCDWKEFRFGEREFKHLEVQPSTNQLPPTKEEQIENKQINEEMDRKKTDASQNSQVDVISIYDYDEKEIEKLENRLIRSISLLMLIARCLPNFEHRLKKNQKEAVIREIYELPNRIFYAWAEKTEECSDSIIQLILNLETNEFTKKIKTVEDAKRLLQWSSISLLLDLYYNAIENAYRENTYEYLADLASSAIDFNSETHQLERLLVFEKRRNIDEFYAEGMKLQKQTKSPAAQLALSRVVYHLLLQDSLPVNQVQRIESKFFMRKGHNARLFHRQKQKDKNK